MKRYFKVAIILIINFIGSFSFAQKDVEWACQINETNDKSLTETASIRQLLNVPDVYPSGPKESGYAYIMGYSTKEKEKINFKVGFCKPIVAKQVVIVENSGPGAITKVVVIDEKGKKKEIYKSDARLIPEKGRVWNLFFDQSKNKIKEVYVEADPQKVQGWNSIDAIGISNSDSPVKVEIKLTEDVHFISNSTPLSQNVNTPYIDKYPIISPDGKTLYYAIDGHHNNIGGPKEDIWFSKKDEKGEWAMLKNIKKPLNNESYNFVSSNTPDDNTLLVGNTYKPDGSPAGPGASITHRTKTGWSVPEPLNIIGFMNKNKFVSFYLANDGKTMVLNIEDDNSLGNLDIYVSFLNSDGSWSKPLNLGPEINTRQIEGTPFLASDGKTLYFASEGYYGYGGLDLFMSRRLDDTWLHWAEPLNLGPKINTEASDLSFSLTASGQYAYTYKCGKDQRCDIHVIELGKAESVKPEAVVLISGKVYDAKTKQPLEAKISYETLPGGKEAGIARSSPNDGEYKIVLPKGKNYGYLAKADGYISVHENLNVAENQSYTEIHQDLYLVPIEVGVPIRMNNVFFVQSKPDLFPESFPELDRVVTFLQQNPSIEIELGGHTDNQGDPKKNMDLSEERVKVVKEYLVGKGVESKRIKLKAYGGTKPIASNATEATRKLNRRVEFTIIKK